MLAIACQNNLNIRVIRGRTGGKLSIDIPF